MTLAPPSRRRAARELGGAVLAAHADLLPDALPAPAQLTSTDLAIIPVAAPGRAPGAVIKLALSDAAGRRLEREEALLSALQRDSQLGGWRRLLPRPLAHGTVQGRRYRVERALAGRAPVARLADCAARRRLLALAADTIAVLHRATTTTLPTDPSDPWVDAHLRELARHAGRQAPLAEFARLRERLHQALSNQVFRASWIHGDYWLGNILCDNQEPVAIVDWEAAAALELPMHDLLHLLLYSRRLRTGAELGQIVSGLLRGGAFTGEERQLLTRHEAFGGCGSLSERDCLLLYWLRHVAMHARQQRARVGYRYRIWERRNVLEVLSAL